MADQVQFESTAEAVERFPILYFSRGRQFSDDASGESVGGVGRRGFVDGADGRMREECDALESTVFPLRTTGKVWVVDAVPTAT